ncbi:MAG: D-inositol-3-phosphate glycosyltransferase, partial [Candidatus Phosphoribacter sp.]
MISVHTSPVDQPGTGDAGGLNVYVAEVAKQLARRGREVEIFTRATTGTLPPTLELAPGVTVRHVTAGPYEGLSKHDLPGQLCAFAAGVMRAGAARPEGWFDLVHSHYWLSGQVGWLAADRWRTPLVHTMHTMARVKNAALAVGDSPEPQGREIGEAQVVEAADRLVANTVDEACQLVELYGADPTRVSVVPPGVDLDLFAPGDRYAARGRLGLPLRANILLFVGRIQPLKAPDLLVKAARRLLDANPHWTPDDLVVAIIGGPSGSGLEHPEQLGELVADLGLAAYVRFVPPVDRVTLARWYRAADLVTVPSYNESFGLVAIEALACGTPVVAAKVGGLPTAVGDGGVLVPGHDVGLWADT